MVVGLAFDLLFGARASPQFRCREIVLCRDAFVVVRERALILGPLTGIGQAGQQKCRGCRLAHGSSRHREARRCSIHK
eukprot:362995-Chlamydomonas_euryale.AAC.2